MVSETKVHFPALHTELVALSEDRWVVQEENDTFEVNILEVPNGPSPGRGRRVHTAVEHGLAQRCEWVTQHWGHIIKLLAGYNPHDSLVLMHLRDRKWRQFTPFLRLTGFPSGTNQRRAHG